MKLSTKGRYGLRALIDLAVNSETESVSISSIAARQGISEAYLEQLMAKLKKAGLVISMRGAQGGYRLAKSPSKYTVGEILRLTEGTLSPVPCLDREPIDCPRSAECITLPVWQGLKKAVCDYLDGITLQDILDMQRDRYMNDYVI